MVSWFRAALGENLQMGSLWKQIQVASSLHSFGRYQPSSREVKNVVY